MKKKKDVPKLRFPEFTGEWEAKKLGEICSRITRKNKNGESELPLTISSQDGLVDQRTFFNKVVAAKDMTNYYLLKRGEYAYNKSYSKDFDYGSIKRLNAYDQGCLSTLYICFGLNADDVDSDYLEQFFDTLSWYEDISQICAEGARNHGLLNVDTKAFFDSVNIRLPRSIAEQRKISSFIDNYDTLLSLQQRKLDQIKEYKKGMLQKMFPKEGESVPEVRFPGFTGEWELRKLGDIAGVYDGTHQTPNYQDHGVMFVSVEDIQTLTSEKYISEEDFEKSYSVVPEPGDILMTRIGDIGTANIVKSTEPLAYYVSLALLKNTQMNADFLKANISAPAFQNELWVRTLHTAYPKKINKDEIGKCLIRIAPSLNEQKKIGCFFKNLDTLITLQQRKLDAMKEYKKGLLQQMFV